MVLVVVGVGVFVYLDRAELEDRLETWASAEIETAIHSSATTGATAGGTSFILDFAKGVGTKVLNAEAGNLGTTIGNAISGAI